MEGYKLVNINDHPFTFIEHLHRIVSLLIFLLSQKQVKDTVRALADSSKSSKEITVSQYALLDIIGLWPAYEYFGLRHHMRYLIPFDILPIVEGFPLSTQRIMVGRKTLIDKFEPLLLEFLYFYAGWTLFHLDNLLLDVVGKINRAQVEQVELLLFGLHFLPLVIMMLFENMSSL